MLCKYKINLSRANMVRDASFDGTATVVTAMDPENPDTGFIEMRFTDSPTRLRGWVLYDASGARTEVELTSFETGLTLPSTLFDPDREKSRGR